MTQPFTQKDAELVEHIFRHIDKLLKESLLPAIGLFVKAQVAEQLKENYKGVYQRAQSYKRGNEVTYDGAKHIALRDIQPCEAPLKSDGWQLCEKSPRQPTKGGPRPQTVIEKRT